MSSREITINVTEREIFDIIDQRKTALAVYNDGDYINCKEKDILILNINNCKLHFGVKIVNKYKDFQDLFNNENFKLFYPSALKVQDVLNGIENKNNTEILAIHFSLLLFIANP